MYGFGKTVPGTFDSVVDKVTQALKVEGFGVISDIDIQHTLKAKIGVEKRPYRILGACNPKLANQALDADPDVGLLLPCNVIVREMDDGAVRVAFLDPSVLLQLVPSEVMAILGAEVKARLERVRDAL